MHERLPRFGLGLVFVALTLLFGGAGAPLESLSALLLGLLALGGLALTSAPWSSRWAAATLWLGGALLLWLGFGLLPAAWVGGLVHPYNAMLESLGLTAAWAGMANSPAAALPGVPLLAAYWLTWAWLGRAAQHESFAVASLKMVSLAGLGFALYGLWVFVGGNQVVLWLPKDSYVTSLSGTFISRNQAATFLGVGILASLGMALLRIGEVSGQLPLQQRLKALWLLVLRPGLGWWLVLAVQWCALILTSSRAGLSATLAGILVMVVALAWARAAVRWWLLGGMAMLAILGLLLLGILGGQVAERATTLNQQSADAGGRTVINAMSWRAVEASPWWGQGYGGWEAAVAVVRTPDAWPAAITYFGNAHNLYLQTLVELGWVGLLLLLGLGGLALACLLHGLATRRRQVVFPAVGLAALVLVAGHSAVDFPLHLPAIVLAWLLLLASGVGQAFKTAAGAAEDRYPWIVRLGAMLLATGVVMSAAWLAWAQWPAWQVAGTVRAIQRGEIPAAAERLAAQQELSQCVFRAPWLVPCGADLTLLHLVQAGQAGLSNVNGQVLLKAAELQAKQTLRYDPANPVVAYRLARALALQGKRAEAQTALTYSILMGPYEPRLAMARAWLLVVALRLGTLNADDTALYQSNLADLWQHSRWQLWPQIKNQPEAASILAAALEASHREVKPEVWQQVTRTPWPGAAPLGKPVTAQ